VPLRVHLIGKILVGLEPLQAAPHLTGELLDVEFLTLDRGQAFELRLRFVDPALPALLIPLLTPGATGNDVALALVSDFHELVPIL
jgi:hypothetical protein